MMYRIACDHRDSVPERYPDGDRPLVYLLSTMSDVIDARLDWVATDGNAATATTEFSSDPRRVDDMVDWSLMTARQWNNAPEDPDRQRRRMAEFLVHRQVPLAVIRRLTTFDERSAEEVREVLSGSRLMNQVHVRPDWYYGYERR